MQIPRVIHWRALPVPFGIVLRRAHVALSVNRVIVAPVGDRTAGDADLEGLTVRERIAGHEPTVAPAPNAYARRVNERLTLQPGKPIFQIPQLELAKVLVERPGRVHALTAGRAVVAYPDDVAFLRQHLMPHVRGGAPLVSHLRRLWTAV